MNTRMLRRGCATKKASQILQLSPSTEMTPQPLPTENEVAEEEETYHFSVEVEDNREPSASDVFIHTFVSTLHKWVVGGVVLLLLGGFLALVADLVR
jgi:hypothetical protein